MVGQWRLQQPSDLEERKKREGEAGEKERV